MTESETVGQRKTLEGDSPFSTDPTEDTLKAAAQKEELEQKRERSAIDEVVIAPHSE
jgi:hypothetical protein